MPSPDSHRSKALQAHARGALRSERFQIRGQATRPVTRQADDLTQRPRSASRPPHRRHRDALLASAALALLAGLLGLLSLLSPVAAQSATTLVSNAGQESDTRNSHHRERSQAFTTGDSGATLASVEIISEDLDLDDAAVSLCTVDGSNHPTSSCTLLTAPSRFLPGTLVFTAPADTTLEADTTYSVLIETPGGQSLLLDATFSDDEDDGRARNWTIDNTFYQKNLSDEWVAYPGPGFPRSLRITIKGALTNNAPTVATAIPDQTATTGAAFSYAFPAAAFTDADSDTLSYAAAKSDDTALPSWLSFDPATRTFSGTPQTAGTVSVKVTASDGSDSVSDTFDIVVSEPPGDTTAPRVASIVRQNPTSSPTNADSLTWRVTFSEAVSNVDAADFAVSGTTATVTAVATVSGLTGAYDVTTSGGDLAGVSATVTLAIASSHNIQDAASNALSNTAPTGTNDNSYVVDNSAPTVTISSVPATSTESFLPKFTFSEAVTGFAVGDITLGNATASSFTTATNKTAYWVVVTPTAAGTVTVDVSANAAQDAAGNGNTAATRASSTFTLPVITLPAITITAGTSPVTEGTSAVFTLSRTLSTTAELAVNVTVSETGGDMVAASNEGDRTVTFLANAATATLSVTTAPDSVDEANSVVTAMVSAAGSPAGYSVGTPASAMVTVQDNDTRDVTVSPTALPVNEGSTGTYTVVLNSQPTASVTVTPSRTGSTDVTFTPATLSFTTSNWSTVRPVTVRAAQDSDAVDDSATISHAVTGGDYASLTVDSVVVTVDDDETTDPTSTTGICSRTMEVQTAILSATGRATCSDVTAADLAAVTSLNVNNYSGTVLDPADFAGLTGLTSLQFSGDSAELTTVPDNAFAGLTALTTLNFNVLFSLTTLGEDAFAGLTTLENLNLSSNLLTTLHADIFDGLTALSRLELQDNRLTALHADIFDDLTALTSLDLNLNRSLAALDADIFDGLTALEYLDLSYTNQTALDADIFDGLTDLENLNLSSNLLTTLHADFFDGLTALKELYLNSNLLTTLDADIFDSLTALDTLALNRNLLTTLDADIFDGLTALEELELNSNLLTTLDADIFDGLAALNRIELHDNRLTALDADIFDGLTALDTLALGYNGLTTLDADIFDGLAALRLLSLSGNSLTTLDADIFDSLTALDTLALNSNLFTTLDADLFDGLTALDTLALKSNLFTTLDADIFDGLAALKHLYLNSNSLTTLDADIFDGLADLNRIELLDNRLTALDADIFDGITLLDRLDLKCNYFTALDLDIFDPFAASLTYLDLMSDSFTTPPSETAIRVKFPMIIDALTGVTTCVRVTVSPTSLTVTEGATGTYTVALRAPPSGDVTLAISSDNPDVTVAPTTALTFTAANWDTAQTVTVSAAQDTDEADEAATLILDPNGNDYDVVNSTALTVTVTDDDGTAVNSAPTVASIARQNPTSSPTNANSLTWRVTFSETVSNVNAADFAVSGTTATVTVAAVSGTTGAYDVTASGGNLASVNGTVALTISSSHNIEDAASNALSNTAPTGTNNNSYVLDNTAPSVTISGVPGTSTAPFKATFTFSEEVPGFAASDITLTNATASSFTKTSTTVYTALVTPTANGTVNVDVSANAARDTAGNSNTATTRASSTYTAALPAITITAGASPVAEGTSAVFTLSRTGSTTAALTVNVTVSEAGGDRVAASNEGARRVTFLANSTTVTLSIATVSDSVDEANSVVTATVAAAGSPASYSEGTPPASAMVTVQDNVTTRPVITGGGGGGGGPPPIPIPSDEEFDWNVTRDIESLHRDNDLPTGIWSNGELLWIVENSATGADRLFAYDLNTGERLEQHEFELDSRNRFSHGIWSNREIVWIADSGQDKLFAYNLATGERDEERDLALDERNRDPRGIWSNGELMLVLDSVKDALFAYDLESGRLLGEFPLDNLNKSPRGIWSDGFTIWVSDDGAKRIFAYRTEGESLNRYEDQEFNFRSLLKAGNGDARGIWSDGDVIFVADEQDDHVYTYNMPDAIDARLASLSLSGIDFGEFTPSQTEYAAVVEANLPFTTVEAEAAQSKAGIEIMPADADDDPTNGHQAALIDGLDITVTVTSEDESRRLVYTVGISNCLSGLSEARLNSVQFVSGSVADLLDCAQSLGVDALYHYRDGEWVAFFLNAPEFLNQPFRNRFAEGVPAGAVLIAKRELIQIATPAVEGPN